MTSSEEENQNQEDFYGSEVENDCSSDNMEDSEGSGDEEKNEELLASFDIDELPIKKLKTPLISERDLKRFKKEKDRTGIVYVSRIAPAMTPSNIRQHLASFGQIGRVYLAPDDKKAKNLQSQTKKVRKATRPQSAFTEGWIEFLNKKDAETAAEVLNGRPYGGRRGSRFREDLWCIKYLGSDFKWSSLTERISYENAVRDQKMREEISQAKRENKAFLKQVEQSRVFKKIEEKRQIKRSKMPATSAAEAVASKPTGMSLEDLKKRFRQRKPVG